MREWSRGARSAPDGRRRRTMANPRKFSEKIALHHQKQAEETAAFEQIMREVSDATNKVTRGLAPARTPLRAGSLPDVSQVPPTNNPEPSCPKPDDQTAVQYGGTPPLSQTNTTPQQQTRGRPTGVGPMRARPQDRKIDTSPYGSSVYLSPPPDSNWRRTNSDSALHQSSTTPREIPSQGTSSHHHHGSSHQYHSPVSHHLCGQLSNLSNQLSQIQQHSYSHSHHGINTALHSPISHRRETTVDGIMTMQDTTPNRPRSSCEVPRVPFINIYPSAHDSTVTQIPVSSNTGSLPDLTSVHFPTIHANAVDRDVQDHSSSPYSTSPVSASPATLSPTSVPPVRSTHSPHHSPRSTGSPTGLHQQYINHHVVQNHLSVPHSNRYLRHSKGVTVESWMQGSYQQQCSPPSLHSSQSNINVPSPTVGVTPQVNNTSNGGYRSPHSPGSSPGGAGGGGDSPHYDAGVGTGSYTNQSAADHYFSQSLQQHFEQFSMDWAQLVQSLVESGVTWTAQVQMDSPATSLSYINSVNANQPQFTQATMSSNESGSEGPSIGWAGGGCSGAAQCIQAGSCLGGAACLPGPHPNTPTTIPDIILTDFSNTNSSGDIGKDLNSSLSSQFSKELSADITSHFDTSLFPEDESLRDGLDPIDLNGLRMLMDPDMNVISDPTTEDAFRLDRL